MVFNRPRSPRSVLKGPVRGYEEFDLQPMDELGPQPPSPIRAVAPAPAGHVGSGGPEG